MANVKAVSNEEIIAALLLNGTVKAAAESCGTSTRTIYDRLKDAEFRELYAMAKTDIMREALIKTRETLNDAIDTIRDIMTDADNPPAIRLQAAQHTVNNFLKFSERMDTDEQNQDKAVESNDPLSGLKW